MKLRRSRKKSSSSSKKGGFKKVILFLVILAAAYLLFKNTPVFQKTAGTDPNIVLDQADNIQLRQGTCSWSSDVQLFDYAEVKCKRAIAEGPTYIISGEGCLPAEVLTAKAEEICRDSKLSGSTPTPTIESMNPSYRCTPNEASPQGRICRTSEKSQCYENVCNAEGSNYFRKDYQGFWNCFFCRDDIR